MFPITPEIIKAITDERRQDADDYRRAKAAKEGAHGERKAERSLRLTRALKRIAISAVRR